MSNLFKSSAFKAAVQRYLDEGMHRYRVTEEWARADEDAITQAFITAVSGEVIAEDLCFRLNGVQPPRRSEFFRVHVEKHLGLGRDRWMVSRSHCITTGRDSQGRRGKWTGSCRVAEVNSAGGRLSLPGNAPHQDAPVPICRFSSCCLS